MRRLLLILSVTLAAVVALGTWPLMTMTATGAADPVTCTGYPEPRTYSEGQSWGEKQFGPASHPGTGKQGHIHVEACAPIWQTVSGTLTLDLTVRFHNMPGVLKTVRVRMYGDETANVVRGGADGNRLENRCLAADCEYKFHMEMDLNKLQYSGWHMLIPEVTVRNEPGSDGANHAQLAIPYWPMNVANGKPAPPVGSVAEAMAKRADGDVTSGVGIAGDSLYPSTLAEGSYARTSISKTQVPWNLATLDLKPLSGVWTPRVWFEKEKGFAYVDPTLHAVPVNKGTVVYEGPGYNPIPLPGQPSSERGNRLLNIDTTRLTDGIHRLLLGSCNEDIPIGKPGTPIETADRWTNCGTQVIRFLVDNTP
jgi:hypothetical protein